MSTPPWDTIPLLALKCILEHLDVEDALLASSTCRHWRSVILMYEGRRDLLKIYPNELERNRFIVPLFKKKVKSLHIVTSHIQTQYDINVLVMNNFTKNILPQFMDAVNLREVIFVGPPIITQKRRSPYDNLNRTVVEELLHQHANTIEKVGFFGCEMIMQSESKADLARYNELDAYHKQKYLLNTRPVLPTASEDMILSRKCVERMPYTSLRHIIFDIELVSTDAIATLAKLHNFKLLSLNVTSKKSSRVPRIKWSAVTPLFKSGLEVAMNIIAMPPNRMQYIIDKALCPGIPMVSVKFMFCRCFYMQMINRVAELYNTTLREFSWVDAPREAGWFERLIPIHYEEGRREPFNQVNPFVFLVWQCPLLKKLDLHGYWFCEYDMVGMARLRPTAELNVSSVYDFSTYMFEYDPVLAEGKMVRVLAHDSPPTGNKHNKWAYLKRTGVTLRPCTPSSWERLHEGLKAHSTAAERGYYIVSETSQLDTT